MQSAYCQTGSHSPSKDFCLAITYYSLARQGLPWNLLTTFQICVEDEQCLFYFSYLHSGGLHWLHVPDRKWCAIECDQVRPISSCHAMGPALLQIIFPVADDIQYIKHYDNRKSADVRFSLWQVEANTLDVYLLSSSNELSSLTLKTKPVDRSNIFIWTL